MSDVTPLCRECRLWGQACCTKHMHDHHPKCVVSSDEPDAFEDDDRCVGCATRTREREEERQHQEFWDGVWEGVADGEIRREDVCRITPYWRLPLG